VLLQVNHYRMSLSWSRLVPNPLTGAVNQAAVDHYLQVLTAIRQAGINPLVTLFHWDLPQVNDALVIGASGNLEQAANVEDIPMYVKLVGKKLYVNDLAERVDSLID
jgi:beta-glucosidase/6-phospho-beta-glucosidase/beta-galactosidase